MHSKSANVEIITDSEKDEIIEDLFESLLQEYQKRLEESMSEFIFDNVDLLNSDLKKISLNRGKSYIDSPIWLNIALNILYVADNTEGIRHSYKSKFNLKHENLAILLRITDSKNGILLL